MTFKADKFSLETEPVASGDNMIFMLKPDDQTFIMSYSTVNRSMKQDNIVVLVDGPITFHGCLGSWMRGDSSFHFQRVKCQMNVGSLLFFHLC